MRHLAIVLGLVALSPLAAFAQQAETKPAPVCAAKDVGLAPELAAWTSKSSLDAASTLALTKSAKLEIGKAYSSTLHPTPHVTYGVQPEKPGAVASSGGMFGFAVDQAGTYGVVLGAAAWIDVVRDGKTITPSTFGHGPECTTIRKIVNFDLKPGDYVIQISGNAEAQLPVMVFRKP